MDFIFRHHNRQKYPQKHILICEDDLIQQKRILEHFLTIFESQGDVQFSVVPGTLMAAGIINNIKVDLIILDHDMPNGSGADLLNWLKKTNHTIPVITFSGIPQNNYNMGVLGATYPFFGKEEVITGKADDLILGLVNTNSNIAELYCNSLCRNFMSHRWWAHPQILVGGSIINAEDFEHLKKDFGIQSVINVEVEHSDQNKNISNLLECQVPDDGTPFPREMILEVVKFAEKALKTGNIYVHCQMGSSRSPAFAYGILRNCFNMSKEAALEQIATSRPSNNKYGHHSHQQAYIKSIDDALLAKNVGIAEFYTNTVSPNKPLLPRYWITSNILVGGNICDQADWEHLRDTFGINTVINVDPRPNLIAHNTVPNFLHCAVNDDGTGFPQDKIHQILNFAKQNINQPTYIHCHLGFSRSPHFTYAILRGCYRMSPKEALEVILQALPSPQHHWGFNQHTTSYMKSIEDALNNWIEQ